MKRLKKVSEVQNQFNDDLYSIIDSIESIKKDITKLRNSGDNDEISHVLMEAKMMLNQSMDELRKALN